jgi:hypothetical protein
MLGGDWHLPATGWHTTSPQPSHPHRTGPCHADPAPPSRRDSLSVFQRGRRALIRPAERDSLGGLAGTGGSRCGSRWPAWPPVPCSMSKSPPCEGPSTGMRPPIRPPREPRDRGRSTRSAQATAWWAPSRCGPAEGIWGRRSPGLTASVCPWPDRRRSTAGSRSGNNALQLLVGSFEGDRAVRQHSHGRAALRDVRGVAPDPGSGSGPGGRCQGPPGLCCRPGTRGIGRRATVQGVPPMITIGEATRSNTSNRLRTVCSLSSCHSYRSPPHTSHSPGSCGALYVTWLLPPHE